MKILYFTKNGIEGTGSGTYQELIIKGLSRHHYVRTFKSVQDLKEVMTSPEDWDIIHILDIKHFAPYLLKYITSPIIVDIHDYYWTKFYPFFCPDLPIRYCIQKYRRLKYPRIINKANGVIVHSKYVLDRIPFNKNKYLLPLGIEYNEFNHISVRKDANLLLFTGRDYFRKGLYTLCKAISIVTEEIPDVQLLVVGREYLHSRILARLLTRNMRVTFINGLKREEIHQLYKKAATLILPSEIEASSFAILESMASGTPVVASNVGGIPEIIQHNKNGLLFEKGDYKALARAIVSLLKEPGVAKRFVDEGYKTVKGGDDHSNRFNTKIMCERLEVIYQDVLNKSNKK